MSMTFQELSDRAASLTGFLIQAWGSFELTLNNQLDVLRDYASYRQEQPFQNDFSERLSARLKEWRRLQVTLRPDDRAQTSDVDRLLKQLNDSIEVRHDICHGLLMPIGPPAHNEPAIMCWRSRPAGTPPTKAFHAFVKLDDEIGRMNRAGVELVKLSWKALPYASGR